MELKPVIRVTTSNTGDSGVNIYPMLMFGAGKKSIALGDPLRLEHKNGATLQKFEEQLKLTYGKYQLAVGKLSRLLMIPIYHPINCMVGVMKRLDVPKRYADVYKRQEVRACGVELGLPHNMVYRQPFPGPGLGVRCLGAITRDRLEAVRESDAILREEFAKAGLDKKVWQYFTVVPDFKSVGVKNNARCFEYMVIIRAVNTIDAMCATIERVDWDVLQTVTDRILKEVENVNRVCYDMSPKPPATIEFE